MSNRGSSELEVSIFLFALSLSFFSFVKISTYLRDIEQRDLNEFERKWNKFSSRTIQRVYKEKESIR
ncbi:hypothetical protein [Halobacteriovorax marinus]|uniref:hypothetical protein n=1 Tax=Halobacteriovorax marinus TaxID=97084 RepID=UPI0002DCD35F|nr:hypothetical protein [Halobacteriovorax marinus]